MYITSINPPQPTNFPTLINPPVQTRPQPDLEQLNPSKPPNLNSTFIPNRHLSTKVRARAKRIIAKSITLGRLRRKDQELVVGDVETELLPDVVVVLGGLVAGATGAVEASASVDA